METAPKLEKLVRSVYDGTTNELGLPERVSKRFVYRKMNLLGHQLENMPLCKAIFERYTESYPESWARKVIWAYHKLDKERSLFYWSDIRKLSGVKKKNLPEIIPLLAKYTDARTVNKIIGMIKLFLSLSFIAPKKFGNSSMTQTIRGVA